MNDQTTKLLEQLASKLGTTSEYLWGVLLKQAPIQATIDLIQDTIVILVGYILWIAHKKLMDNSSKISYDENEGMVMLMIIAVVLWSICFIGVWFCLSEIISGYFNPEYWALHQLLHSLSSK